MQEEETEVDTSDEGSGGGDDPPLVVPRRSGRERRRPAWQQGGEFVTYLQYVRDGLARMAPQSSKLVPMGQDLSDEDKKNCILELLQAALGLVSDLHKIVKDQF